MTVAPELFDRKRLAQKIAHISPADDFVTDLIYRDLADRVGVISRDFHKALLLAPLPHHLRSELALGSGKTLRLEAMTTLSSDDDLPDLQKLDEDYDLVISLYDLAIINDVPHFLDQMRQRLKSDGLFIAAFVGGTSLTQLRQAFLAADAEYIDGAAMRVVPMIDTREAGALLQRAKFALPVADVETHTIRYGSPLDLLKELRALGGVNPLASGNITPMTKTHLQSALIHYADQFADPDTRISATLEIIWMSGWVPHESQQKPLKPGSATARLADILKDHSDPS